jgi:NADH-quinone oxidoreductase subunit G
MIDVCPVGALTDNTFRFASRVWFTKPLDAHRNCTKCSGKAVLWMKGDEVLRVSARKDKYNEVEDWICNDCRFENKNKDQWVIDGPRNIAKDSVISQNHYENIDLQKLKLDINRQIKFQGGKDILEHNSRVQFDEESKKALEATKK